MSKSSPQSLLVIIPAFNEENTIGQVVTRARKCAGKRLNLELEVCVIDDGSTDDTAGAARRAGADHILVHKLNQGVGAAVRSGLVYGRGRGFNVVVKLDGDAQHDPADVPDLITPILEDQADVVYGNRFPRLSYRMPLTRRVGNAVFRGLMRWLVRWDIQDSQPGIFAVNKSYLEEFSLPGDYNYTQQVLLDAYLKGMRFAQVPVTFRKREKGSSFVSLKYPFKVLPQILMMLILIRPLKFFLPLALAFLLGASGVFLFGIFTWLWGDANRPVEHVNLVLGLAIFGLNTGFFGLLAELIVYRKS